MEEELWKDVSGFNGIISTKELAKMYNVTTTCIYKIHNNINWKHLLNQQSVIL